MRKTEPTFWIIGAGQFGTKAAERLSRRKPDSSIVIVDQDLAALKRLGHLPLNTVRQEGASYLAANLDAGAEPDWIIPAVPIHLAFEWARLQLSNTGRLEVIPVPIEVERILPNPIRGLDGQVFMSYADFVCPDNCTEPIDICTFTGKPRKGLLFRLLEEISHEDYPSVVVRSHQLAPGVGGYKPEALKETLQKISQRKGQILYSTACLCHGVMHAFKIS